mmetsp:Transcript_9690/g.12206  ORF Transcript_9690/g.12206 Transcript_9690/m.12206 type:complete len:191 (-) Transcript_9690:248-820(-)
MRFITHLTLLASALYASAADFEEQASALRGFVTKGGHNLVAPIALEEEDSSTISLTADLDSESDSTKLDLDLGLGLKKRNCIDAETWWVDSNGDNCDWYDDDNSRCDNAKKWENNQLTAKDVCCACNGGIKPSNNKCKDYNSWKDENGNGCDWYNDKDPDKKCGKWAKANAKGGLSANDQCCICGGGKEN